MNHENINFGSKNTASKPLSISRVSLLLSTEMSVTFFAAFMLLSVIAARPASSANRTPVGCEKAGKRFFRFSGGRERPSTGGRD